MTYGRLACHHEQYTDSLLTGLIFAVARTVPSRVRSACSGCCVRHLVLTLSYFLYSSNVGKRTSSVFLHPISNMTTYMARMISRRPAKPTAIVPQLKRLIEILRQKRAEDPDNYRAMVFVQRRIVCRTICEYLRLLPDFRGRTSFVTGQSSNDAISSFGAKSFTRTMHDFACGEIDVSAAKMLFCHRGGGGGSLLSLFDSPHALPCRSPPVPSDADRDQRAVGGHRRPRLQRRGGLRRPQGQQEEEHRHRSFETRFQ